MGKNNILKKLKNSGRCIECNAHIKSSEFKNPSAKKMYERTGLCQACQDEQFGFEIIDDGPIVSPKDEF